MWRNFIIFQQYKIMTLKYLYGRFMRRNFIIFQKYKHHLGLWAFRAGLTFSFKLLVLLSPDLAHF